MRRRLRVPDSSDQEQLCYRDSATQILFTWTCRPTDAVQIWIPGQREPLMAPVGVREQEWAKTMDLVSGFAIVVGSFTGTCLAVLHLYKKYGKDLTQQVIDTAARVMGDA